MADDGFETGEWPQCCNSKGLPKSEGLFTSGCQLCLQSTFFTPCLFGELTRYFDPHKFMCAKQETAASCTYFSLCCIPVVGTYLCACIPHWLMRRAFLEQMQLKDRGGEIDTFFLSWCCTPCSMAQMKRELENKYHMDGPVISGMSAPQVQNFEKRRSAAFGNSGATCSSKYCH